MKHDSDKQPQKDCAIKLNADHNRGWGGPFTRADPRITGRGDLAGVEEFCGPRPRISRGSRA